MREDTPPIARLAIFFAFVPRAKTRSCPAGSLPGPKSQDFFPFRSTFSDTPPSTSFVVQINLTCLPNLPGWQRQCLHPAQHASEQAPRQMVLRQQWPVVTGMLHQPSTCLQQPLLQADRRPILDSLGQLLEFLVPGGSPATLPQPGPGSGGFPRCITLFSRRCCGHSSRRGG